LESFAEALKVNATLQEINFKNNEICDYCIEVLVNNGLMFNESIHTLCFGSNSFGIQGLNALANYLDHNSVIQSLDISNNKLDYSCAQVIGNALRNCDNISEINLSGNEFGDKGLLIFLQSFSASKSKELPEIDLSQNKISLNGKIECRTFSEMLKSGFFSVLNLSRNIIEDKGAKAIADAIRSNASVFALNLSGNKITYKGAREIAESLENNGNLIALDLSKNSIEFGSRMFVDSLRKNIWLQYLNLKGNYIDRNSSEISNQIARNKSRRLVIINLALFGFIKVSAGLASCYFDKAMIDALFHPLIGIRRN
jgi:Ran GTPase-activating protein (RanGAP) involved in mRNA processing and transport